MTDKQLRQYVGYAIARGENIIAEAQASVAHFQKVLAALNERIDAPVEPTPEPEPEPVSPPAAAFEWEELNA